MPKRGMILLGLLLTLFAGKSANPSRFQYSIDYRYSLGLSQRALGMTVTRSDFEMHGNSVHVGVLYNISDLYSAGLGLGLDVYEPSPNSLPVYASFRYRPVQTEIWKSAYCFTDLGYGIPVGDDDDYSSGCLFDLGVGWQQQFKRHFALDFKIGYNLRQFRANMHEYDYDDQSFRSSKFSVLRNSLMFGIGLMF